MTRPPRRPSIRPSLVDAGWEEVPSVVPQDTMVGGSTESNELTSPIRPSTAGMMEELSEHTLSEPTGDLDELLEDHSGGLGLPAISNRRLPRPPSMPTFTGGPSSRPPPPSSRRPQPSSHPPPMQRRVSPFAHTQPLGALPKPPPPLPRVPPPRPHLPSGMPVQRSPFGDDLPDLAMDDPTEQRSAAGLFDVSPPDGPPSSTSPSSRLPAGIVIPDSSVGAPRLDYSPAPPPALAPSPAEATQPASRVRAPLSAPTPSTSAPSVAPDEPPLTLVQALTRRVRVGTTTLPLGVPVVVGTFVVALTFGGVMALIGAMSSGSDRPVTPSASATSAVEPPSASEALPDPDSANKGSTPLERAASGDEKALFELSGRPAKDRTIAESLAIASGQSALRKRELATLGKESKNPGFANDASNVKKLLAFLPSDETARPALEIIARLESSAGPDVLYQIWTSTTKRNPNTELAEALVLSKEVRGRASPALAVALDLRTADSCDKTREAVTRAAQQGDRRSIPLLVKLQKKNGCGESKRDDCYPCLRDGDELKDALKEARKRASPRY